MDAPHPALSEPQRRVLWLLSQGRTRDQIALDLGHSAPWVQYHCRRILHVLQSATAAQAVRNGLLGGHIGPWEDCGSLAAYRRHIKDDEPTCAACRRGNAERTYRQAATGGRRPQLTEPQTRLLRALAAGRTNVQIRTAWNVSEKTLAELSSATYAALGVGHLSQPRRREAALHEARRLGLLGTAPPQTPLRVSQPAPRLSSVQVRILAELASGGCSIAEVADRLGINRQTCSSRLSETYQRLGVAWMDKSVRRETAIRRAREAGLLPDPANA